MREQKELCALCNPSIQGERNIATTNCLKCDRPICVWHGYPKYKEGEKIKTENFIGRICYLCMTETA